MAASPDVAPLPRPAWRPRRRRGLAALAAVVVTVGGLLSLGTPSVWRAALPPPLRPMYLTLPPAPAVTATRSAPAAPRVAAPARRVRPVAPAAVPAAPAVEGPQMAATVPVSPHAIAPPAAASAPAPLRLGPGVLRQAARDSVSETRRLAAAAGQPLDEADGPRLADDVAAAGKPDCLAANPGGSLLSIPMIAWQALRQKCR